MARSDMSDLQWDFIKAVLPNKPHDILPPDEAYASKTEATRLAA